MMYASIYGGVSEYKLKLSLATSTWRSKPPAVFTECLVELQASRPPGLPVSVGCFQRSSRHTLVSLSAFSPSQLPSSSAFKS